MRSFLSISMLFALSISLFSDEAEARRCRAQCAQGYTCFMPDPTDPNGRNDMCVASNQVSNTDCVSQYNQLAEQCRAQVTDTTYTCDEKNDSGMSGIANSASQLSLMFGQQTAGSIQAACSKMASFSSAANAAVAAYRLTCQSSITSCHSACDQVVEYVSSNSACLDAAGGAGSSAQMRSSAESAAGRCNDFDAKVAEANQAINNFAGTMQNAAQCASLTSGDSTALPELCKANPSLPGCEGVAAVDCTNPAMSGNKVCVCAKNPSDPVCMSEKSSAGSTFISSTNPGSRLSTNGADLSGGDLPSLPSILPGKPGSGGAGEAVDGKQGGGAGISSMGGGGGGGASGGAAGEEGLEDGVQVNAGFYGGGGSFGGSGMGSGGGERGAAGMAGAAGAAKGKGAPDLRQFLPGGKFDPKSRGLAGNGGPDGITGPHSNIWLKIQNRYQVLSPTLMP
ncbi:hypothetical protein ACES2J_02425 [Bdellovibrio bacteriovorus]|uniref:hypothetical protein n=1 Tax=Bdellovibrio bacteriovorus TaxID=959 RepID=UPI0035A668FF